MNLFVIQIALETRRRAHRPCNRHFPVAVFQSLATKKRAVCESKLSKKVSRYGGGDRMVAQEQPAKFKTHREWHTAAVDHFFTLKGHLWTSRQRGHA